MKSGTRDKDDGAREKKPVQESLGRITEQTGQTAKERALEEANRHQRKTGQIRRDFGR